MELSKRKMTARAATKHNIRFPSGYCQGQRELDLRGTPSSLENPGEYTGFSKKR